MQRIQREAISGVSLTRSPNRFVGVLRLPRLRTTRFHGGGLPDDRTREGVLSLKHRRCNETNQYHPTQQSPHENDRLPGNENVHGRTSGDEERLTITTIILRKKPDISWTSCLSFFAQDTVRREEPPGAMLRYHGRLTTPSACHHIVRLSWLSYPR
jgi:hypothetical protein